MQVLALGQPVKKLYLRPGSNHTVQVLPAANLLCADLTKPPNTQQLLLSVPLGFPNPTLRDVFLAMSGVVPLGHRRLQSHTLDPM